MKQKIVIKVQMACEKCKVKAMSVGAVVEGVNSLTVEGAEKDRLVVIGEDVDPAILICKLRKKLCCYATILSVEEVKVKPPPPPPPKPPPPPPPCTCSCTHSSPFPQFPKYCEVVYDENPNNCSIL